MVFVVSVATTCPPVRRSWSSSIIIVVLVVEDDNAMVSIASIFICLFPFSLLLHTFGRPGEAKSDANRDCNLIKHVSNGSVNKRLQDPELPFRLLPIPAFAIAIVRLVVRQQIQKAHNTTTHHTHQYYKKKKPKNETCVW
jgi:hypothetical protein